VLLAGQVVLAATAGIVLGAEEPAASDSEDSAYVTRATGVLQQALEAGDALATARAQLSLAEHMYAQGLWAKAATHAELGRSAAQLAGDPSLVPELEHFMARAFLRMGRSAEAIDLYLSLLDHAERTDDRELAARASLSLSSLQGRAGDVSKAEAFAASALDLATAQENADLRARALLNLARLAFMQDAFDSARKRFAEARELPAENLSGETRSSLLMAELNLATAEGDIENALDAARRALSASENLGSIFFRGFARSQLGVLLCRSEEPAEGIAMLEQAAMLFEQSDAPFEQSESLMASARCLAESGRPDEAYQHMLQSRTLLQEAQTRQRSAAMEASLAAFQSERQLRELTRLADEEQVLRTRVSEQKFRIALMVIGILLLAGLAGGLWLRQRRVAEQRAAEQKLAQTRIDLLARTSHEIRNPAQGLIGLLEHQASSDPRYSRDPDHQSALAAARMIQHLSNDYLDLSLLERGELRICNEARCNVTGLVDHVRLLARSFLGEAMPALNVSIDPDLPEWIHADADRLMQVLLNLIVNAARYGGKREIHLALGRANGDSLVVRVDDRGPGLGDSTRHLFDPYVRGDTEPGNSRGSGLGLPISTRIVEAMGGSMQAYNRDGGGARFEINLPLRAAEAPVEEASSGCTESHDSQSRRERVLVVDDDLFARTGIRAVLDSFGCETFEAADWSEMQSIIDQQDPPLVLLDRHLFCDDGLAIASRLRELDRRQGRRERRIVMISGSERPSDIGDDQLDDWIMKPVTRAQIAPLLDSAPTR